MPQKNTLVLGASLNEERYSNMAIHRLLEEGHSVLAVGLREGFIANVEVLKNIPEGECIDTVSLYLSPVNQEAYIPQILAMKPKRIIFNPGTENPIFEDLLTQAGVEVVIGCTLVMLSVQNY